MIGKRNIFNTSSSLVLIDEGHGNNTPDKRSPIWENGTQLFEWEFNRFVGDSITKLLNLGKISNNKILTEIEDISLSERKERIMKLYTE
jgi:N-acetylmuramoyl-L-alanine amidase